MYPKIIKICCLNKNDFANISFCEVSFCKSTVFKKIFCQSIMLPKHCSAKENHCAKVLSCKRQSGCQRSVLQKKFISPKYPVAKNYQFTKISFAEVLFCQKKPKYRVAKSSWPKYQFAKLYGFVKVSFCPNATLPKYHFGNMSFCQNIVMPKQHIAEFCQVSVCLHNDGPKSSQHDNLGRPFAN